MISEGKETDGAKKYLPGIEADLKKETELATIGEEVGTFPKLHEDEVRTLARHVLKEREIRREKKKWIYSTVVALIIAVIGWLLSLIQYLK